MKRLLARVLLIPSLVSGPAAADTVADKDATHYGRVLKITDQDVSIGEGCGHPVTNKIPLQDLRYISFNKRCKKPDFELLNGGVKGGYRCNKEEKVRVYEIIFTNNASLNVTSISLENTELTVMSYEGGRVFKGPLTSVASIWVHEGICRWAIKDRQQLPAAFKIQ